MKPFLIDNDKVYTYQDLLDAIQTDGFYYPYYKVHDVFLYFVNLVKALANNQSLVLLDSDLNSSEIENLNESLVNQPRIINTLSFSDISEVINAVKKSAAEITIFTSGTTGQPKKVLHSISSLTRSVRTGERYANQICACTRPTLYESSHFFRCICLRSYSHGRIASILPGI